MIQKSDLIILVLASSALFGGIYRWHKNTQDVDAVTIPANTRVPVIEATPANTAVTGAIAPTATPEFDNSASATAGTAAAPTTNTSELIQPDARATGDTIAASSSTTATAGGPAFGTHVVASGDSLSRIAAQYGTTVSGLQDINQLSGTVILVGQELQYPLPAP